MQAGNPDSHLLSSRVVIIKRGAQYSVYPAFGGRVLKLPNTRRQAIKRWEKWVSAEDRKKTDRQNAVAVLQEGKKTIDAMRLLCAAHPELEGYLGSPIFYGRGVYSQQKVEILGKAFRRQSHEQNVAMIKQYAEAVLLEWRYGFADSIFNFTLNNGLAPSGRIALIDFGEVVFDKRKVEELVKEKRWLQSWSYSVDMPKDLQDVFKREMAQTLTLEKLNSCWRTLV